MEQIQKLLAERDVYWVNWLSSKERESAGKKPESADEPPSVSTSEFYVPQPSAASPTSQPQYGMPMNYFSGQTVTPTYTDPIMSIPGSANISRTNEIVQYTPPESSRNSVPHTGPISDEMFDRYVQCWQNRQRPVRPVYQSGQTGSPQPVRPVVPTGPSGQFVPNQREVSTSTQPNSSSNFDKMLTDYKNDLANLLRESFGVEVRSKTRTYQKPYPTSFDSVAYPAGFRLAEFVKFS